MLWLWHSVFSHVSGAAFEPRLALCLSTLNSLGPKREYWLGGSAVCRQFIYSPLQRAIWREELTNVPKQPLCQFCPPLLSYPSLALETPSRKEAVVVKDSAGFLCTSSVSCLEKTATKTEVVLDIVLSLRWRVWVILQRTKHFVWSLFAYVQHSNENATFTVFNLYILTRLLFYSLSLSLPAL